MYTCNAVLFSDMSVQAQVNDLDALTQALGDARNDGEGVNRKSWVLVGHVNNSPNQIQLVGQVSVCAWNNVSSRFKVLKLTTMLQNFCDLNPWGFP